jgi:putative ABC transport system permease protein
VKNARGVLLLFVGAVTALVLIGCTNIANLLIARGAERAGELALRSALGASRGSLVRLLLAEPVARCGGGSTGALLSLAVGVIGPLIPATFRHWVPSPWMDALISRQRSASRRPARGDQATFAAARPNLMPALSQASARATGVRWRLRQLLVGVEVTLAVVLLVAGGLMVNTMVRLLNVDLGYTPESTLTMRVQLPRGKEYPKRSAQFVDGVISAAHGVPGVARAAVSSGVPLANMLYAGHYRVEGFRTSG